MVLYEVTVEVAPEHAEAFARYMRETHIPDIWATGCFRHIRFARASAHRFRTWYEAEGQAQLDRYLREFAPGLRAHFQAHAPEGTRATREVWSEEQRWP